jgi:CDP-diacylglycerol pyrophosphatase
MGAAWKVGERRACSACGKECIGAKSRHGSVGPIELEPNERGNVLLFKDAKGDLRYAVIPTTKRVTDPEKLARAEAIRSWVHENLMARRMNHFSTCPEAERFRREREESDDGGT